MYYNPKKNYSPQGSPWNFYSASFSDGTSDPGVPQAEDGDNDMPPVESSSGDENLGDMSASESSNDQNDSEVDPSRTNFGDPKKTR